MVAHRDCRHERMVVDKPRLGASVACCECCGARFTVELDAADFAALSGGSTPTDRQETKDAP